MEIVWKQRVLVLSKLIEEGNVGMKQANIKAYHILFTTSDVLK